MAARIYLWARSVGVSFITIPDFSFSVSNTPMTIFASQQPAQFNGSRFRLWVDTTSQVHLSCAPVSTCIVNPTFVIPPGGPPRRTPLTATVSPATRPEIIVSIFTEPEPTRIDYERCGLYLEVVDFNLTAPSPPISRWSVESSPDRFRFR